MIKTLKLALVIPTVLALVVMPIYPTFASQDYYPVQNPQTLVCQSLNAVGLGCGSKTTATSNSIGTYQPKPVLLNFDVFSNTPVSVVGNSNLTSTVSNAIAPKDLSGQKINLVSVPNSQEIYELVNGQKHAFPSLAIFYDYGYTLDMVQPVTQFQLDKYPRADIIKIKGNSALYYLTEGGLIRPIVNNKILDYYGDRTQDAVVISRKEFNFYPTNQYVYQESPLNRDVFQISGSGKRYLTPMAVARLGIRADQVAPVSKSELDFYKTLAPLVD